MNITLEFVSGVLIGTAITAAIEIRSLRSAHERACAAIRELADAIESGEHTHMKAVIERILEL